MIDRHLALEILDTWKKRKTAKGFIQGVFQVEDRYIREVSIDAIDGESYVMVNGSNPGEVAQLFIEDVGFYNNSLKITLDGSVASFIFKTRP